VIYVECESNYPFAKVVMLPKGVNEHNPLRVSFGDKGQDNQPIFRFENGGWKCLILQRWLKRLGT
jgi:hypothetical protein